MKSLALLLAFFTLFSTVIPCCAFDNCKDEPQSENSTNDEEGSCSPFFVCSSCAGFVTLESHSLIAIENVVVHDVSTTNYPDYSLSFYSQICLGIWQPPKVG